MFLGSVRLAYSMYRVCAASSRCARPISRPARQPARKVGIDQRLDLGLDRIGELVAVRAEQLDPVVLERIVRSRNHHAEIGAERPREHRDGGRRHRSEQIDVHPDGGEAGGQRALDHVAGAARVLADHDAVAVLAFDEVQPRRHPDLHRELRRQLVARASTNAVGTEIRLCHAQSSSNAQYTRSGGCHKRQCRPLINRQFWKVSDSTKRPAGLCLRDFPQSSAARCGAGGTLVPEKPVDPARQAWDYSVPPIAIGFLVTTPAGEATPRRGTQQTAARPLPEPSPRCPVDIPRRRGDGNLPWVWGCVHKSELMW